MGMTQSLKGIDNIKKAMERRVEEREEVMKAEAIHGQQEAQARTLSSLDSSIS